MMSRSLVLSAVQKQLHRVQARGQPRIQNALVAPGFPPSTLHQILRVGLTAALLLALTTAELLPLVSQTT